MDSSHQKILEKLVNSCGVSGYSEEIAYLFLEYAHKLHLLGSMDSLGSVSVYMPTNIPKSFHRPVKNIMISAHIDSVGYVVYDIYGNSLLKLAKVGMPFLEGQTEAKIKTGKGPDDTIPIIVDDPGKEYYFAKGTLKNKSDINFISIGDPVYYDNPLVNKPKGKFTGAYMDNKASILVMLMAMEKLVKHNTLQANLYFVLTSFKEIGAYGAQAAVQKIKPIFAINLDVFPVFSKRELSLGTIISIGSVYNNVLSHYVQNQAEKYKIPFVSRVPSPENKSDTNYILPLNGGTPCCELGVPCMNTHLPNEIVSKKGIQSTAKLLTNVCINSNEITNLIPGGQYGM